VTDEAKGDTEKWVSSKGAKYAYGYDKGSKLARYFNVSGIPAAVLVDASGTVVWQGHPGSLDESLLAKATSGALPKPLWEWTAAAKAVKNALLKKQYKLALEESAKLTEADGGPAIKSAIEGIVKSKVEGMKTAFEKGDFLGAETASNALQKELDGLPEQAEAAKMAADIKADAKAAPVLKAQRQIAKIREADLSKRKDIDAAIEDLQKLQKNVPGTFAAEEAAALILQLRASKKK
jgi:hypothetical protein